MGIREELFCDFVTKDEKSPRLNMPCINPVVGACFFCGSDFCKAHEGYSGIKLELKLGGIGGWLNTISVCSDCEDLPSITVPRRFERRLELLWGNVEAYMKRKAERTKGGKKVGNAPS